MWLSAVLLAGFLANGSGVPTQSTLPQPCIVYGEVFWSETQITAELHSNCPIEIEQKGRGIIMTSRRWIVQALIPEDPGVHKFVYQWGQSMARFGDKSLAIAFGPLGGA